MKTYSKFVLLLAAVLLSACGTNPKDPLEPFNRASFALNRTLDKVAAPVARAYVKVTPSPVRTGISNFFSNLGDLNSSVNCLLQTKVQCSAENLLRFGFNSVFGIFGLLDIAGEAGIPRTREDFGQTLGYYGVPPGAYIMLPVGGPATVRDLFAERVSGRYVDPLKKWDSPSGKSALGLLASVNGRAGLLQTSRVLDEIALDPYTFLRDAHLQRRRNAVYDGNPPEEVEDASPDDKSVDKPAIKPSEKPSEKPAEKPAEKPEPKRISKVTPAEEATTALVTEWGVVQTEATLAAKPPAIIVKK